jgi:hypothetical protein
MENTLNTRKIAMIVAAKERLIFIFAPLSHVFSTVYHEAAHIYSTGSNLFLTGWRVPPPGKEHGIRPCLKNGKTPSQGIFFHQDCVDLT